MRILVTGASGLLGRHVANTLREKHYVRGAYHTRPCENGVQLEVDDFARVHEVLQEGNYTHVVHCAALRDPDYCLRNPEEAYRVNALAVENLARLADEHDFLLAHISTDYVFSGEQAPYHEDDATGPVNLYGRTKLAGELAARTAKRHLILRIPALWSLDFSDPRNCATKFAQDLRKGDSLVMDAICVRYYTLAEDVAAAAGFLLDEEMRGIYHLTAEQKITKAGFAKKIAEAIRIDSGIVIDGPLATGGDTRPLDSHMSPEKYLSLQGPKLRGIDEALADRHG
jgi:dTDP-4-dehydrorhamnose reductase